ncbi:TetR/AcrR family transcriptional regulator [Paraconexibacter sp.]|uniref:TetR/AcrR family transcriptional regulator n=1 Tax=Paraconexibacter sp. TaxID=2949640 RepID=UPI003563D3F8
MSGTAAAPSSGAAAGTRERLLLAARELTVEGGYGAASVLAIAERAGVAAGTLYRHFPSKGELFAELFRAVCDAEVAAAASAGEAVAGASAADRIEAVIGRFAERALRRPRLAWALIAEPVDPVVDVERLAYRRAYARDLAALLREGIAAGELPPQDVDIVAAALVGGAADALVGPTSPVAADPPPPEQVVAAIRAFARRAVGAPGP